MRPTRAVPAILALLVAIGATAPATATAAPRRSATLLLFEVAAEQPSFDAAGDRLAIRFVVLNTGPSALSSVEVDARALDASTITCDRPVPATLGPGERLVCRGEHVASDEDAARGAAFEEGHVRARTPDGAEVQAAVSLAVPRRGAAGVPPPPPPTPIPPPAAPATATTDDDAPPSTGPAGSTTTGAGSVPPTPATTTTTTTAARSSTADPPTSQQAVTAAAVSLGAGTVVGAGPGPSRGERAAPALAVLATGFLLCYLGRRLVGG